MHKKILIVCCWMFFGAVIYSTPGEASVIFNEILADPASDLSGDANGDGIRSGTDDEFIELYNSGVSGVDLSGWSLSDSVSTRHIFPAGTNLASQSFLVVFGGGSPALGGVQWQTASTGGLGLNNSGDTVSLNDADSNLINQILYGNLAGNDQAIALSPDGEGTEFALHSEIDATQGAPFSPGTSLDGRLSLAAVVPTEEDGPFNPTVPELPTFLYFATGWGAVLLKRS